MSEKINTFLLKNPFELIPMDRKDFYEEQVKIFKETGSTSRAIEIANILLFNSHGELIVQKRSYDKAHNPGLLDKSIGGHIQFGDTPDYTVMVETIQELQTPSIVLKNKEDFLKTYELLGKHLETVSVIKYFNTILYSPIKIINGVNINISNKMYLYFGVYDGRIRPVDREPKGVLFYSIEELEKEIISNPSIFTDDIKYIIQEYKKEIEEFVNLIKKD